MSQCTAKAKRTGKRCRANAIRGKDKCRVHGGMTPVKHGFYSKYKSQRCTTRIEELLEDPDLLDMRRPIAVLEALTSQLLEKLEKSEDLAIDKEERAALMLLAKEQAKAIERYYKVTEGTKHTIRIEQVQAVVYQIVQVANETITDISVRKRFVDRIGQLAVPGAPSPN